MLESREVELWVLLLLVQRWVLGLSLGLVLGFWWTVSSSSCSFGSLGKHWQPRKDGAHHKGVSHPQQSVGTRVQPLQWEVWGLHTGNSSAGWLCFPPLSGREQDRAWVGWPLHIMGWLGEGSFSGNPPGCGGSSSSPALSLVFTSFHKQPFLVRTRF